MVLTLAGAVDPGRLLRGFQWPNRTISGAFRWSRSSGPSVNRAVPEDFKFTLKAWQLITHGPCSPTCRSNNMSITEDAQRFRALLMFREAVWWIARFAALT